MMVLGPVFHFELVRIARRWGLYAIRFSFGLILLLLLLLNFLTFADSQRPWRVLTSSPPVTLSQLAQFGQSLFYTIMAAQGVLVCFLTPGLVADAIAGERQRKTLHYLMNSRVWAGEIVLGKLASRMLHLAVFVAVTLPILSLLTLLGGTDPVLLVWSYAATLSTGFLLASLGIFASATIRRPRDAMLASYTFAGLVLAGPAILGAILDAIPAGGWSPVVDAVRAANAWLKLPSPISLLTGSGLMMVLGRGPGSIVNEIGTMIAAQLIAGGLIITLAALLLRPAYRWIESRGAGGGSRRGKRRWRVIPRPTIGAISPMLWKELFVSGNSRSPLRGVVRVVLILLVVGIVGLILWWLPDALGELLANGYGAGNYSAYTARSGFNIALRVGSGALIGLWLITLGGAAAGSIALEREQDTWLGLLATPLDGAEILRAKMLGPLARLWPLGVTIVLLWMIGLVSGAVHPLGFILGMLALGLFTWYAIALGALCSLRSRTAWRAQGLVLAILIAPHFCCIVPNPLYLTGLSLFSWSDVRELMTPIPAFRLRSGDDVIGLLMILGYAVGGPLLYLTAAWVMTRFAFRTFDSVAERPRRFVDHAVRPEIVFLKPGPNKPKPFDDLAEPGSSVVQK